MSEVKPSNQRQFHSIVRLANEISDSRERIQQSVEADPTESAVRRNKAITRMLETTYRSVMAEKHLIEEMVTKIETIISARREAAAKERVLPTTEMLQKEFNDFFCKERPIVQSPYPPLCGALPWPDDQIIPNGSFVCAINNDIPEGEEGRYILAMVIGFDPENALYHVCDCDPEQAEIRQIWLRCDEVIPLSTSVPARRSKATSYPLKSKVLALWYEAESGGWTSVFYPAEVKTVPTTVPGNYQLVFEGDPPYIAFIPEAFVVMKPEIK